MSMKKALLISLIVGFAISVRGQSIVNDRLAWSVTGFLNKANQESIAYSCRFESEPGKIKWIQKGGSVIYEFSITGKQGAWKDASKDGELTYSVTFRNKPGTIRFARSGSAVTIETDVPVDGKNSLPYTFNVSSVNPL